MKSKTAAPSTDSSVTQFERQFFKPNPGRTLVVGSHVYPNRTDRRKLYDDVVGIDIVAGPGVDIVLDLEDDLPEIGQFDHVDCISVLEHSRRPWLLAANLERLMRGTIYVTVPFCWRPHSYPSDYWRMTPEGLRSLFNFTVWDAVLYAHTSLTDSVKIPAIVKDGHRFMARTETVGFGRVA